MWIILQTISIAAFDNCLAHSCLLHHKVPVCWLTVPWGHGDLTNDALAAAAIQTARNLFGRLTKYLLEHLLLGKISDQTTRGPHPHAPATTTSQPASAPFPRHPYPPCGVECQAEMPRRCTCPEIPLMIHREFVYYLQSAPGHPRTVDLLRNATFQAVRNRLQTEDSQIPG